MPEVTITIGGRKFEVACQDGEEHYLQSAASLLDAEASSLQGQIGRMPETRMLLMCGLMLADKMAGMEDKLKRAQEKVSAQNALMEELERQPDVEPQRIEVPVVPQALIDSMAELTARAESLAEAIDEKTAG